MEDYQYLQDLSELHKAEDRFIIIRADVLTNRQLTMSEKLVYARICGFKSYFESLEACAEVLGISQTSVKRAKQKLTKLGFIREIKNTGRGKVYQAVYEPSAGKTGQKDLPDGSKRPITKTILTPIEKIENKEESKDYLISNDIKDSRTVKTGVSNTGIDIIEPVNPLIGLKEVEPKSLPAEPVEYGNDKINNAFKWWADKLGYEQKNTKANRFACHTMLRSKDKGREWLARMIHYLVIAKSDKYSGIKISNFSELQRDYEKLEAYISSKRLQTQREMATTTQTITPEFELGENDGVIAYY